MLTADEGAPVNSWTEVGIAAVVVVGVIAAVVIGRGRRRTVAAGGPAITRRELMLRGIIGAFVAALSGVVASFVAFVWPTVSGAAGQRYELGSVEAIRRRLAAERRPYVGGHGHFYLVSFPADRLPEAQKAYPAPVLRGMEAGLVALSPVCTHQGCQVPYCASSSWFECPCHGSRYDGVGEQRRGPAPRGLDHFAVIVEGGVVTVDTSRRYPGPAPGTLSVRDAPSGPHCY